MSKPKQPSPSTIKRRRLARARRRPLQREAVAAVPKAKLPFYARRHIFYVIGALILASFLIVPALPFLLGGPGGPAEITPVPVEVTPSPEPGLGKSYAAPPAMQIDPEKRYFATITTEKGDIRLELFPKEAPQTVNNFVFLAREGFYNGLTFHRVISGTLAQAGDPSGEGIGGPGYTIEDESGTRQHLTGALSMANTGQPHTAGSQFFITMTPQPHLDGKHAIFGQVLEGLEVLSRLAVRDPSINPLYRGTLIKRITIEEQAP